MTIPLQWRHNGHDNVSNHKAHGCLLNHLFRRRSKKTSKLRVIGIYAGNSPGTGEFPAQMASNAENFPFDDVIMRLHDQNEICNDRSTWNSTLNKIRAWATWWRHQMETFSALLAPCAGNSPVNSPHKGQWRGALIFSLICTRINDWVNNREAGDLRRHRGHYDVSVMFSYDLRCREWTKPMLRRQSLLTKYMSCEIWSTYQ